MAVTTTTPPLRLEEGDLFPVLRFRVLLTITALATVFAAACLLAGAGKWVLLVVVAGGSVIAIFSPESAFALCIFLFAFRNDAFMLGPLKIADPLYAVTAFSWVVHAVLRGKLRLHLGLLLVGLYATTDVLSGLGAQAVGAYGMELIRQLYLVSVFVIATQVMGSRKALLMCVYAYVAAALVMAECSYFGLFNRFVMHGTGAPFFGVDVGESGRFGFCSIAVETERVASYLIFPMLLVAGLQAVARTGYERRIAGLLFWLGFGACALTFSRASLIYILTGLTVMWALTGRHLPKLITVVGILAGFMLFVILVPANSPLVAQYNLQRWAIAGELASEHQEPRLVVWDTTLRAFQTSPIYGIGLDNVMARSMEFRDKWLAYGILQYTGKPPHNAYLSALSETGVLGTITLLLLLGYLLQLGRRGLRAARAEGDRMKFILAAAVFGAFVAQIAGGLTFQVFTSNHVWVLMSFLVPLGRFTSPQGTEAATEEPKAPAPAAVG